MKLKREHKGFYYNDTDFCDTAYFWTFDYKMWHFSIGKSMPKLHANTLKELKQKANKYMKMEAIYG